MWSCKTGGLSQQWSLKTGFTVYTDLVMALGVFSIWQGNPLFLPRLGPIRESLGEQRYMYIHYQVITVLVIKQ